MKDSTVYYLPAWAPAPAPPPAPSRWTGVHRTWWRVRFALTGLRLALSPARTSIFVEEDARAILGQAELVEPRPRPARRAARVIDFDAARARLRPVAPAAAN